MQIVTSYKLLVQIYFKQKIVQIKSKSVFFNAREYMFSCSKCFRQNKKKHLPVRIGIRKVAHCVKELHVVNHLRAVFFKTQFQKVLACIFRKHSSFRIYQFLDSFHYLIKRSYKFCSMSVLSQITVVFIYCKMIVFPICIKMLSSSLQRQ